MLLGIHDTPSIDAQKKRMTEVAKMPEVECFDLTEIYYKKLNAAERNRIEKLEIFDEFEEWDLL
jgi:tRNA wybutosine-synthesizing protein 4